MTMGPFLDLSGSRFLHLCNGNDHSLYLIGLLGGGGTQGGAVHGVPTWRKRAIGKSPGLRGWARTGGHAGSPSISIWGEMPLNQLVSGALAPSAGHKPKSLRGTQHQNLKLQVSPGESRPTFSTSPKRSFA